MTDQTKNVEALQTEVDNVSAALTEAKKLEDETLKKTKAETALLKAETILTQVKTAKEEANTKLKALEGKTDATSKAEITKLEAEIKKYEDMLSTLDTSKTELTTLKSGVTVPAADDKTEKKDEKKDETKTDDTDKSWLRKQRDGVTSKEERKTHTGANIARVAGGIGIVALGVRGLKKLFGRGKKKEEKKEGETEEKKGFRETGFGKFLKRTGIGTGAYYLIHGFSTGKRGLKDFFDREKKNADTNDEDKDKVESYKERAEQNPEDKEKYETLGTNVDDLYSQVFDKEMTNNREDDADMSTVSENVAAKTDVKETFKGVVPFCMDNGFSSVGSMLSEKGIEIDIFEKDYTAIKTKVLSWISSGISFGLVSFLGVLPSFLTFATSKDDLKTKVENRLKSGKPEDRIKELKFFFREQMRVTTYLQQKQEQLVKKIAEEKFAISPKSFEDVDEAMKDADRMKTEVYDSTEYKNFREGNILNAIIVLKDKDIFDGKLDEDKKELVHDLDLKRDDILDGTCGDDIIKRSETDMIDGKLETANATQIEKSCTAINKDIEDNVEDAVADSMRNIYGDLANSDESVKREFLKNSPFKEAFKTLKEEIGKLKVKIKAGTFTAEDFKNLKKFVNNYFAFKKELLVGANAFQTIKDKDGNFGIRLGKFFLGCLQNMRSAFSQDSLLEGFGYFATGAVPIISIIAGVAYLRKGKNRVKLGVGILKTPGKLTQATLWTAKLFGGKYYGPAGMLRRKFFDKVTAPDDLATALREGKISLNKASQIADGGANGKLLKAEVKARRSAFRGNTGDNIKDILIKKSFNAKATRGTGELKLVRENLDNTTRGKLLRSSTDDTIKVLKKYDVLAVSSEKKTFFNMILDSGELTKADVEKIIAHADKIDISGLKGLTANKLEKIAKALGKDISTLTTADAINAKITELKKGAEVVEPVVEELTETQKILKTKLSEKITVLKSKSAASGATSVEKVTIEESITTLEDVVKNVKSLPEEEGKAISKLLNLGVDIKYTSRILAAEDVAVLLKRIEAAEDTGALKVVLSNARFKLGTLAEDLKTAGKMDDLLKEFKPLIKEMKLVTLLEEGKDITKVVKALSKVSKVI